MASKNARWLTLATHSDTDFVNDECVLRNVDDEAVTVPN